jgi:uncharacterized membrane protein YphA (DoxX/SURF4 family)
MKYIMNFSRVFVGLVFIFSGTVKGIDPLGTAYRIDDYLIAYGVEWAMPLSLFISIFLCTLEFVLGISLLFNAWIKKTSWILFPMMIFFTILTFVDAIWEPVPDCGCFGDAIKMTNWETFYKNILLIILTAIIFFKRKKFNPPRVRTYAFSVLLIFSVGFVWLSLYNLNHLPIIDFREWKVGNDMDPEDVGEAKIYLTFKNKVSGELKEYLSPDYPWQDSVWLSEWEFVSQRVDESEMIRTHNLVIEDDDGNVHTNSFISNTDFQFYIIAYDLRTTDIESFSRILDLYKRADEEGYSMIVLTSSLPDEVIRFKNEINADPHFDFYYSDDIVLKTIIRSNPGLMLMKDGVVLAKWHYNDLPEYEEIKDEYMKK